MRQVHTIAVPSDGVNEVPVPEGGKVIDIVIGPGYAAALAVLAEHDAPVELREYFVTRGMMHGAEGDLRYIGSAQEDRRAALYVFEIRKPAADAKPDGKK
jgi:hypothetical protein